MHLVADFAGVFHLLNFAIFLGGAQVHDTFDEFCRSMVADIVHIDTGEVGQPYLVVATVGRGEMHLAAGSLGGMDVFAQLGHGHHLFHAHFLGQGSQRRLVAHPDDIVDFEIIAENNVAVLVKIDDGGDISNGETEEIEEIAVLAVFIGIGRIIHGSFAVA